MSNLILSIKVLKFDVTVVSVPNFLASYIKLGFEKHELTNEALMKKKVMKKAFSVDFNASCHKAKTVLEYWEEQT